MIQYKNMKMQVELKSSDKFTQSENKSEQIKKNSHNNNFFKTKSEVFSTLNLLKFIKSIFCASPADPNPRALSFTRIRAQIFVQQGSGFKPCWVV